MKANELRIGNWLLFREKRYCQVSNLGDFFSTQSNEVTYGSDDITDYNPIPLTPEILVKAGFKKGTKGFYFKGGLEFNPKKYIVDGFGYVEIKHVHQLQNLYFALTGEELIFEP